MLKQQLIKKKLNQKIFKEISAQVMKRGEMTNAKYNHWKTEKCYHFVSIIKILLLPQFVWQTHKR